MSNDNLISLLSKQSEAPNGAANGSGDGASSGLASLVALTNSFGKNNAAGAAGAVPNFAGVTPVTAITGHGGASATNQLRARTVLKVKRTGSGSGESSKSASPLTVGGGSGGGGPSPPNPMTNANPNAAPAPTAHAPRQSREPAGGSRAVQSATVQPAAAASAANRKPAAAAAAPAAAVVTPVASAAPVVAAAPPPQPDVEEDAFAALLVSISHLTPTEQQEAMDKHFEDKEIAASVARAAAAAEAARRPPPPAAAAAAAAVTAPMNNAAAANAAARNAPVAAAATVRPAINSAPALRAALASSSSSASASASAAPGASGARARDPEWDTDDDADATRDSEDGDEGVNPLANVKPPAAAAQRTNPLVAAATAVAASAAGSGAARPTPVPFRVPARTVLTNPTPQSAAAAAAAAPAAAAATQPSRAAGDDMDLNGDDLSEVTIDPFAYPPPVPLRVSNGATVATPAVAAGSRPIAISAAARAAAAAAAAAASAPIVTVTPPQPVASAKPAAMTELEKARAEALAMAEAVRIAGEADEAEMRAEAAERTRVHDARMAQIMAGGRLTNVRPPPLTGDPVRNPAVKLPPTSLAAAARAFAQDEEEGDLQGYDPESGGGGGGLASFDRHAELLAAAVAHDPELRKEFEQFQSLAAALKRTAPAAMPAPAAAAVSGSRPTSSVGPNLNVNSALVSSSSAQAAGALPAAKPADAPIVTPPTRVTATLAAAAAANRLAAAHAPAATPTPAIAIPAASAKPAVVSSSTSLPSSGPALARNESKERQQTPAAAAAAAAPVVQVAPQPAVSAEKLAAQQLEREKQQKASDDELQRIVLGMAECETDTKRAAELRQTEVRSVIIEMAQKLLTKTRELKLKHDNSQAKLVTQSAELSKMLMGRYVQVLCSTITSQADIVRATPFAMPAPAAAASGEAKRYDIPRRTILSRLVEADNGINPDSDTDPDSDSEDVAKSEAAFMSEMAIAAGGRIDASAVEAVRQSFRADQAASSEAKFTKKVAELDMDTAMDTVSGALTEYKNQNKALASEQKRANTERAERAANERKSAERQRIAQKHLVPIFDFLSIGHCMRALEMNGDDPDRAMEFVLAQADHAALRVQLGGDAALGAAGSATPAVANDSKHAVTPFLPPLVPLPGTGQARLRTQIVAAQSGAARGWLADDGRYIVPPSQHYVVGQIIRVTGGVVIIRALLDRNRIPLDPDGAPTHAIDVRKFLKPAAEIAAAAAAAAGAAAGAAGAAAAAGGATPARSVPVHPYGSNADVKLLSDEEVLIVMHDMERRVPLLIYQAMGRREFSPISIDPPIDFSQYKMDIDDHTNKLRRMSHKEDGTILVNTQNDKEYGLWGSQTNPIDLYTSTIDGHNHNVIHLHLEDLRNDITIDSVNLTPVPDADGKLPLAGSRGGSGESHADAFNKKDVSGRTLTYRICVRNGKVEDVLHRLGRGVASAKFNEIALPAIGGLMAGPGQRVVAVRRLPTGLVVTNKASTVAHEPNDVLAGIDGKVPNLTGPCKRKHPEELTGYVLVDVLAHESRLVDPPQLARVPVCELRHLNDAQRAGFERLKSSVQTAKEAGYLDKLTKLERAIAALQQSQTPGAAAAPAGTLLSSRDLDKLRIELTELGSSEPAFEAVAKLHQPRLAAAIKQIRMLAYSSRLGTGSANAAATTQPAANPSAAPAAAKK